ncbi:MAG: hypothetical protein KF743_13770 [Fimbriimonadaceae bacterium]|nr:hypothetical protein [Fimbriimonadaceae bacterium]
MSADNSVFRPELGSYIANAEVQTHCHDVPYLASDFFPVHGRRRSLPTHKRLDAVSGYVETCGDLQVCV